MEARRGRVSRSEKQGHGSATRRMQHNQDNKRIKAGVQEGFERARYRSRSGDYAHGMNVRQCSRRPSWPPTCNVWV